MVVTDLSAIFDLLDESCRGYLTPEDLAQFHEALYFSVISYEQIEAAITQVCGSKSGGQVYKEYFPDVLQELDRRRTAEQKAYWDFQALDMCGTHRISSKDALLLMKATHGDYFSMSMWKAFQASRTDPNDDVYFDEIKMWLCNLPTGDPCDSNEFVSEEQSLESQRLAIDKLDYENRKKLGEDESTLAAQAKEKEDYVDMTKRQARRKHNKWEREGLEAMIHDDGRDSYGDTVPRKVHNVISINELLDALEFKYDALREKLFKEMVPKHLGEAVWMSMSETEKVEKYQQLKVREKHLRKDNLLQQNADNLFGAEVSQNASLLSMMGEIVSVHNKRLENVQKTRIEMKAGGKNDAEVELAIEKEYLDALDGPKTSGKILVSLQDRHTQEKDFLLALLKSGTERKAGTQQMLMEYCKLVRQHMVMDREEVFPMATVATGLAERHQELNTERPEFDCSRQEQLATHRLEGRKGRKQLKLNNKDPDKSLGRDQGIADLQIEVTKEMTRRHQHEIELMIDLLQGKSSSHAKASARQMDKDERDKRLTVLRQQRDSWKESSAEYRASQHALHIRVLQEGVGVYFETRRAGKEKAHPNISEDQMNAVILADLQQKQDQEFHTAIKDMQHKGAKELNYMRKHERKLRQEEHNENIASLVLGSFECSEEEKEYVTALSEKYEALREKLIEQALRIEHGDGTWEKMPQEDKSRTLIKKLQEEKKFRNEGRMDDLIRLLGAVAKDVRLRYVMGESRMEYERRMESQFEEQQQRALQGHETNWDEYDEVPEDKSKPSNPLAELQQRFFNEQHALIQWLRSDSVIDMAPRKKELHLLSLKREVRMIKGERDFSSAGLLCGLLERWQAARERRHKADRWRQERLAENRVQNRLDMVAVGQRVRPQMDDHTLPEKEEDILEGDLYAWEEAYMKELDKKHKDEQEILLNVLMDESLPELIEAAQMMTVEEKQKRLMELQGKRRSLNLDMPGDREENICVLEEAAAIRSVIKKTQMIKLYPKEYIQAEVTAGLLKELQDLQDQEAATLLSSLADKDAQDLQVGRSLEIKARKQQTVDNVLIILTRYDGPAKDEELRKALEDKYDALRDKLLMEALMKQLGDDEWARLSEQERQKRLIQLKLQEKKLRREGKMDELAKLLGEGFQNDEHLRKLMGDSKAEYERKLKERLARRQKRIEQGLDPDDDDDNEGIDENTTPCGDPLSALQNRYEEERKALLARLHGMDADFLSERERQAALVRLRREKLKAEKEDNFDNAALLIGLAERNQAELMDRLKNDRQRQEELAKKRLEALRKKRGQKSEEGPDTVVTEGDSTKLQQIVIALLESRHEREREMFLELLSNEESEDLRLLASASTEEERMDKLMELMSDRNNLRDDAVTENLKILQDGTIIKMESRRNRLSKEHDKEVDKEEVFISLLADLQQQQDLEAAKLMKEIVDQSNQHLIDLQRKIINDKKNKRADNIAAVIFHSEESRKPKEADVLEALEGKYDALRDKLLTEALLQQMGEAEWKNLSEQERQRKLIELKLKEKKLRKEGKYDEAAALLGDALKDQETLEKIFGDNKAEQERKLKERLERRKQRIAEGMSEEDADKLEQEEAAQEEEEEMKRRRNILLDLDHRYDLERDALLKGLRDQDDSLQAERARQAELARLKREQRKARQEDHFDAAAIALGLAQKGEKAQEEERLRQEQLARERLAARRQRAAAKKEHKNDIPMPADEDNIVAWHEAITQEMELKHSVEREYLAQLLQDQGDSPERQSAKQMSADQLVEAVDALHEERRQWRFGVVLDQEEQNEIFQTEQSRVYREAAVFQTENKVRKLETAGQPHSEEDAHISLLADLQGIQDEEVKFLVTELQNTQRTPQMLKQLKMVQAMARKSQWNDNIAAVLLASSGIPTQQAPGAQTPGEPTAPGTDKLTEEEKELVNALEQKYDAMRDKLLMEGLMKQYNEAEWAAMSERDRQAKLIKLKLQAKKLRQEGKEDEAAALFGDFLKTQEEITKKYGNSKEEQERRLQERLARKRQLLAQREAEGLTTDEQTLESIIEEEEKKEEEEEIKKRKNILEGLQTSLDAEKEALLAALRGQDDRIASERQRQLELAKLRHEQKKLKQDDKLDTATVLLQIAQSNERKKESGILAEKERQRELARLRLEERRNRKAAQDEQDKKLIEDKLKLEAAENQLKDMLMEVEAGAAGAIALQESLLVEVDKKQHEEQDMLVDLIMAATADKKAGEEARKMDNQSLKAELERLHQERLGWRQKCGEAAQNRLGKEESEEEKNKYMAHVAEERNRQYQLMTKAMVYKLQVECNAIQELDPNKTAEEAREEVGVALMTCLQEKHDTENHGLAVIIMDKDDSTLKQVLESQRVAKCEGWMDNLNQVVFTRLAEEDIIALPDEKKEKEHLEQEYEKEKQELLEKQKRERKPGEEIDTDAMMKELNAQYEAKRKAMNDALEKQREAVRKKLEARKNKQDNVDYDKEAAFAMLEMVNRQNTMIADKKAEEKGRQGDLMQQRLAARREARRKAAEEEEMRRRQDDSRPSSGTSLLGLRREKTAFDVTISDDDKQAKVKELVQEQSRAQQKFMLEQSRHEELLKQKLEQRKYKRENQAAELFKLGERQKTILQQAQNKEKERQITLVKDRVARVRRERTMTMKESGSRNAKQFEEMIEDGGASALTKDERMQLAAKQLQDKFMQQQQEVKDGKRKTLITQSPEPQALTADEDEVPVSVERPKTAMTKEEQMAKLKERRQKRKEQKKQKASENQDQEEVSMV